jgi:hypothetical protein
MCYKRGAEEQPVRRLPEISRYNMVALTPEGGHEIDPWREASPQGRARHWGPPCPSLPCCLVLRRIESRRTFELGSIPRRGPRQRGLGIDQISHCCF